MQIQGQMSHIIEFHLCAGKSLCAGLLQTEECLIFPTNFRAVIMLKESFCMFLTQFLLTTFAMIHGIITHRNSDIPQRTDLETRQCFRAGVGVSVNVFSVNTLMKSTAKVICNILYKKIKFSLVSLQLQGHFCLMCMNTRDSLS